MVQQPQAFIPSVAPVALAIHELETRLFPEALIAQFADETGWYDGGCNGGRPDLPGRNNLAGISPDGKIANYPDLEAFAKAYVATIQQDAYGYPAVLAAKNPDAQMLAFGRSEWSTGHYTRNGVEGGTLVAIYDENRTLIESAVAKAMAAAAAEAPPQAQGAGEAAPPAQDQAPAPAVPKFRGPIPTGYVLAAVIPAGRLGGELAFELNAAGPGGIYSLPMYLDTGAAVGVEDEEAETRLKLPHGQASQVAGLDGQAEAVFATELELQLGSRWYKLTAEGDPAYTGPSLLGEQELKELEAVIVLDEVASVIAIYVPESVYQAASTSPTLTGHEAAPAEPAAPAAPSAPAEPTPSSSSDPAPAPAAPAAPAEPTAPGQDEAAAAVLMATVHAVLDAFEAAGLTAATWRAGELLEITYKGRVYRG
jgi:hypothetical protein